jgi:hypothetical protein
MHKENFFIPGDKKPQEKYQNKMRPKGLGLHHLAANLQEEYAMLGCPTHTGKPWTKDEMLEAVVRGPHHLAMSPKAIQHFGLKAIEKVKAEQAILQWENIKNLPPPQLKILPIAAISHKSKAF